MLRWKPKNIFGWRGGGCRNHGPPFVLSPSRPRFSEYRVHGPPRELERLPAPFSRHLSRTRPPRNPRRSRSASSTERPATASNISRWIRIFELLLCECTKWARFVKFAQ
jgi:hypothetical protein